MCRQIGDAVRRCGKEDVAAGGFHYPSRSGEKRLPFSGKTATLKGQYAAGGLALRRAARKRCRKEGCTFLVCDVSVVRFPEKGKCKGKGVEVRCYERWFGP